MQITVEAMEHYITDLKDEAQEQEAKCKKYHKEVNDLSQQLHMIKDVNKRLKSKEKDQERRVKEIDQLRRNANKLENSLNMKQHYCNKLEEQLSRCSTIEIQSIFKHKKEVE